MVPPVRFLVKKLPGDALKRHAVILPARHKQVNMPEQEVPD